MGKTKAQSHKLHIRQRTKLTNYVYSLRINIPEDLAQVDTGPVLYPDPLQEHSRNPPVNEVWNEGFG